MRLPGTKFQDHLWKRVRNLLMEAALQSLRPEDLMSWVATPSEDDEAGWREAFQQRLFIGLASWSERTFGLAAGNIQGDTVYELAVELVLAVDGFPKHFSAFRRALCRTYSVKGAFWATSERGGCIGKLIRNFAAEIRDVVDHANYVAATGKGRVPVDFMVQCRIVELIARRVQQVFKSGDLEAMSAILNRELQATPIESGRANRYAQLRPEWIINWSASQTPEGPLHTLSHKHGNLRFHPEKIREILELLDEGSRMAATELREMGDPNDDVDALVRAATLGNNALPGGTAIEKRSVESSVSDDAQVDDEWGDGNEEDDAGDDAVAPDDVPSGSKEVLPRPRSIEAEVTEDSAAAARRQALIDIVQLCFGKEEQALQAAIWQKLLPFDDWPEACFDAATGEAFTVEQLAKCYGDKGISVPTFRKRRDAGLELVKDCITRGLAEMGRQDQEE